MPLVMRQLISLVQTLKPFKSCSTSTCPWNRVWPANLLNDRQLAAAEGYILICLFRRCRWRVLIITRLAYVVVVVVHAIISCGRGAYTSSNLVSSRGMMDNWMGKRSPEEGPRTMHIRSQAPFRKFYGTAKTDISTRKYTIFWES